MKALSLWQPWASAIALGHKRIETRHWSTGYRGLIAIHAAKRWTADERDFASVEHTLGRLPAKLPLGAVVATAMLVSIRRSEDLVDTIGPIERLYGNYAPKDVRPLPVPFPCIGRQGLFEIDMPDDVYAVIQQSAQGALL
ncbi:hypothetical protein C100_14945 [Sphingobium sp. C100]|uniref:ASCH domain-containing protein n=1 Tax=Sphingobium sp. C100 TaxID=1207055 RepID=UPI0003D6568C|nr:ASCH domain-containing protein [Sphingobium sp. C100]ETI62979.1 hypothetical protein C100_14945 [Sphingobium sp. C100]